METLAKDKVISFVAVDAVAAVSSTDNVVAAEAANGVIAAQADDYVRPRRPIQFVGPVGPNKRRGPARCAPATQAAVGAESTAVAAARRLSRSKSCASRVGREAYSPYGTQTFLTCVA